MFYNNLLYYYKFTRCLYLSVNSTPHEIITIVLNYFLYYKMLTNNMDTDIEILLNLSYTDLENYCFTNQKNYNICKTNNKIQTKLRKVDQMVKNVL
jgi:hypothetical protein